MLRAASQALRRGLATAAGAEAHGGLVELRQYTLKPEGIKARLRGSRCQADSSSQHAGQGGVVFCKPASLHTPGSEPPLPPPFPCHRSSCG